MTVFTVRTVFAVCLINGPDLGMTVLRIIISIHIGDVEIHASYEILSVPNSDLLCGAALYQRLCIASQSQSRRMIRSGCLVLTADLVYMLWPGIL
jgi:hypothetical protein